MVGCGVVLVCGMQLVLCVWGWGPSVEHEAERCSRRDAPNVCCLGVVGIDGSVFERYSSGLFLSRFSFNLDFSLFARSSIQVIFFTMIFFSLSLYLTERLESSALLNMIVVFC